MTPWIDLSHPITEADIGRRCLRGALAEGSLEDLRHCYGMPVAGCDCSECAGESATAAARTASPGAAATPSELREEPPPMTTFATFTEDDERYADYLRQLGKDPALAPSFHGREPPPPSQELQRHEVAEWARSLGYRLDDDPERREFSEQDEDALYRSYVAQTGRDPESMPSLRRGA
jgi:hypothetical protein